MTSWSLEPPELVITDVCLVDHRGVRAGGWLAIGGDRIVETGSGDIPWALRQLPMLSGCGDWLAPGLIDAHCHGALGVDFAHADASDAPRAVHHHAIHGTTRLMASVTCDLDPAAALISARHRLGGLAGIIGVHLEGPFINYDHAGALDRAAIRMPEPGLVTDLSDAINGLPTSITIAPELPGGLSALDLLASSGATVMIGHSGCSYDEARLALDVGAVGLTHAFNAMPPIRAREPGPVLAAIDHQHAILELILDGKHLDDRTAAFLFECAPSRIALVSDCSPYVGLPAGTIQDSSRGQHLVTEDAVLLDGGILAGSTLTLDRAVRRAIQELKVEPAAAVAAVTRTPAELLGIDDRLGTLKAGMIADLVTFDQDWRVTRVWRAGERCTDAAVEASEGGVPCASV